MAPELTWILALSGPPRQGSRGVPTATGLPLRVKSRHDALKLRCLLYPQKRTFGSTAGMSALCHKRTHALQQSIAI